MHDFKISNRNIGLDLLRAIAIILVLISHGRWLLPDGPYRQYMSNGGYFGVELFFVISGFLIGTLLVKMFSDHECKISDIKSFWIRRWMRTLPLYYFMVIVNCLSHGYLHSNQFSFDYLFFFQNFYWPCGNFMPESWSLSVEEWFYLLLPMYLYMAVIKLRIKLILALAIAIFLLLGFRLFHVFHNAAYSWDADLRKVVALRLDSLLFGVIMSYFVYKYIWIEDYSRMLFYIGITAILCSIAIYNIHLSGAANLETLKKSIMMICTSVGFCLCIPFAKNIRINSRFISKLIVYVSVISYSLYLTHLSLAIPIVNKWPNVHWLISYLAFWLISFVLSSITYYCIERTFLKLRDLGFKNQVQHSFKKSANLHGSSATIK